MYARTIGRNVYNTSTLTEDQKKSTKEARNAFQNYCIPKNNQTVSRHKFFTRKQEFSETIDEYVLILRTLGADCDFSTFKSGLICYRIVSGIRSNQIRETLFQKGELDLDQCLQICRAAELSEKYANSLTGESDDSKSASGGQNGSK